MDIYIDKRNLESFIKSRKDPRYENYYEDCVRMLRRQLHINYNFPKSRELLEDEILGKYFILSGNDAGWGEDVDTYLTEVFPNRPVGGNVYRHFNIKQNSAIYLIDDERTNLLKEKGCSIVGSVGEEVDTLNKMFCGNDYDFHKLYDIQDTNSFPDWYQLKRDNLNLPLSDIIIMDRFLGTQEELIHFNLYQLIEVLAYNVRREINIVLFCDREYYNKELKTYVTPKWEDIRTDLLRILKKKTGVNGNVTFVFLKKIHPPHDRIIFTNYMLFRSGDSFCYFNSKGQIISNGYSLDVNSLAKRGNYDFAFKFIKKAQSVLNNIKKDDKNEELIKGNRRSNYLLF